LFLASAVTSGAGGCFLRRRLHPALVVVSSVSGYIRRWWLIFAMAVDLLGPMPRNLQQY